MGSSPTFARDIAAGKIQHGAILRLSRELEVKDTILIYDVKNSTLELTDKSNPRGRGSYGIQPLSDAPVVAPQRDGSGIWIVERPVAAGRQGRFNLLKVNMAGDTVLRRAYTYAPRAVTRAQVDAILNDILPQSLRSPRPDMAPVFQTRAAAEKAAREVMYLPKYHPPVTEAIPGSDGRLWLRREDLRQPNVEWNVFSEKGTLVATFALPRKTVVRAAERNTLWAEEHDDMDVTYLVRYRLGR